MGRSIALVLALIVGVLIAWGGLRLPTPVAADAPLTQFSAERAMADVRMVAARPHPMGSAANHAVRDRLLARMTELGLAPRVRRDDVFVTKGVDRMQGGSTESLIGVLPGRDRSLAPLALMAHYDSVPGAPGGADDASGVATALETVRAIRAEGVPVRDVAVILTDGEEMGLFGARAIFADDPLARRLGFVLNLEARGSGGRVQMFETGRDNGAAIDLFRRTAVRPSAGSLFSEVYERLPNDTDFSLARQAGIAGFNYAFTSQAFDYHAPTDTPANLQPGSLQDLGDQALSAARALAFSPSLPPRQPDAVYGVLFGDAVLAYPPAWGWAPLAVSAALIALALVRARRRDALTWSEAARGAGWALYALTSLAAVLHLAGAAAAQGPLAAERLLAVAGRWEVAQLLLAAGVFMFAVAEAARGRRIQAALLALVAGLGSCAVARGLDAVGLGEGIAAALLALAVGGQPADRPGAWAGVLLLGLAAACLAQILAPQIAYVLTWPLVLGALGAAATDLGADRRRGRLAALMPFAAIGVGWAAIHAHLIVVVTSLPELLALPLFMSAMTVWPLAQPAAGAPPERLTGRALLFVGAVLVAVIRLSNPWDARHPQPAFVAYQLDQDSGRAWRVGDAERRSAWSDAVLRADGGRIAELRHWAWPRPVDAAPAKIVPAPAPITTLAHAEAGLITVKVATPPGARTLTLHLSPDTPARLVAIATAATDAPLAPGRWTQLRWTAPPEGGLTLVLRPGGPGRLQLRYAMAFDDWPAGAVAPPPPPAGTMATGRSGETLVTGSRSLAW
ncbi:M20/M25/M40 family metallo-hydrolase [Phenylobacterium sp. LjRoot225]|uniref:M20/M25/M40 family metallo-hydrolase n=1 Tax=Phenylobacterium sp. LjRoot225 TaxID=3342285 RepID=UPI003ED12461